MKHKILLLAAALVLTSLSASAQNTVDKQGRRQGHWIRTEKNGVKIYEGDFIDGLETGTFTYYYADGTVRIRNTYSEPGKRCTHEAYDEKGHLMATGEYNQRNRDGLWKFYAEDGRLVKEASYKMGVKDGRHVVYEQNGDTAEISTWTDNRRNGRWWRRLGKNGYITATYVNGGIEGHLMEYDDNGILTRDCLYTEGLRNGQSLYYEHGNLTVREDWTHGVMVDRVILLPCLGPIYESIHNIVCMAAKGQYNTVVVLKDSTQLNVHAQPDIIFNRAGNELFSLVNRKSRVMVAVDAIQGIGKDNEGRDILLLEPQPEFAIFPDEDGLKLVKTLSYREHSPLDDVR
jgi:antitoxin component YwqK of YwqJK toxin-antitoxin module